MRIWIGFALVGATFAASVITIYGACQPLSKYWQINPDPGGEFFTCLVIARTATDNLLLDSCQGAVGHIHHQFHH
jgi:hypothetical protein